ncbi:hypothetical protein [Microvirga sp. TS319]|uniref:hypothetical protein n=1 Tax=Microvirga sp. TS319 TaxID=3241165 RepID=UPI00351A0175
MEGAYTFDLHRILLRTSIVYFFALVMVRTIGKCGMGQLAPFDLEPSGKISVFRQPQESVRAGLPVLPEGRSKDRCGATAAERRGLPAASMPAGSVVT